MNKKFIALTVLILFVSTIRCQTCFDSIKKLAEKDKCLSSRADVKIANAKAHTKETYFNKVVASRCNGTAFACGLTMSWVTEVFEGLSSQYTENKLNDNFDGSKIGYSYLVGDELRNLFKKNRYAPYLIIYRLRFTGDEDHVFSKLSFN